MIANIAGDDDLILPHSANPTGSNFRERHENLRHSPPNAAPSYLAPRFRPKAGPNSRAVRCKECGDKRTVIALPADGDLLASCRAIRICAGTTGWCGWRAR